MSYLWKQLLSEQQFCVVSLRSLVEISTERPASMTCLSRISSVPLEKYIDNFYPSDLTTAVSCQILYNSLFITRPYFTTIYVVGYWGNRRGREGSVEHITGCSNAETGSSILQKVVSWLQLLPLLWSPQENEGKLLHNASLARFMLKF
jgi:hypothetical protein